MDADGPGRGPAGAEDGPPLGTAPARWSAPRVALIAIASFLAAVLVSFPVGIALGVLRVPPEGRTAEQIFALTLASDAAMLVVLLVLSRRLLGLRLADLGFRRPTGEALRQAATVAIGLWLLSIAVNIVQIRLFGPHPQSLLVSVGAHRGTLAMTLDMLSGAVVAPVAEETFFRGLLFAGLAQHVPLPVAAGVAALIFAASHGLGVIAPIFVLGLGLAWVYARTRTLWAPILVHATVNAVSLALTFTLPR